MTFYATLYIHQVTYDNITYSSSSLHLLSNCKENLIVNRNHEAFQYTLCLIPTPLGMKPVLHFCTGPRILWSHILSIIQQENYAKTANLCFSYQMRALNFKIKNAIKCIKKLCWTLNLLGHSCHSPRIKLLLP